ncbi:uncharacterized protein SRS1_11593 [Sporisorium reilianum f. sp. reilianum]|uniref:BZIP domain-containing protein n=1 Tax=Sporisorium reilianum f. sp. reilianum TaxID=72559 RepID=A0A2N8U6F3_9BASI|nr:uncharacterized protein SRS1_11593 [Sporisorium reilianum f. sp. reilianum]
MPTTSAPSPSASTGKQRTRNAQAQADLRVRRKNYIKTLEDTVSSLEACVRQLRSQNAELSRRASCCSASSSSSSSASSSSKGGDADDWHMLKAENARLYAMLAEAGLTMDQRSEDADVDASTSVSNKAKSDTAKGKDEQAWSSTCSITTKKRKLSKMQAFAQQVDSQLSGGVAPDFTSTSFSPHLTDKNVFYLPDHAAGPDLTLSDTLSSSRSSRGDSVVSHRSPKTPRFEATALQDEKEALESTLAFGASTAPVSVPAAAWYDMPVVLAPVPTSTGVPAPANRNST